MDSQTKKWRGGRVKRKQIAAEDGWTAITHGSSKGSLAIGKDDRRIEARHDGEKLSEMLPTQVVEGLTPEKLLLNFRDMQARWSTTALARQIEEVLGKRTWNITDAVCIGIGSFSRDWPHRWRSLWQLVLFISVVQNLQRRPDQREEGEAEHEGKIKLWAQDPAFTDLDIEFLRCLDVNVAPTGIESHISTSAFVYSPFVDWFLLLPTFLSCCRPASEEAGPGLYVGNEILDDYTLYAQTEAKKGKLKECNELGKIFLKQREVARLGEFEAHAQALNGMVMYWVKDPDR